MKSYGKLKASYTVETALVLPIVFGILFALLLLILIMFQTASQLAIMNMYALYGTNHVTGPYAYMEFSRDSNTGDYLTDAAGNRISYFLVKGLRDKNGYIINPSDNVLKNGITIYNILSEVRVRDLIGFEYEIKASVQNSLNIIQMLKLSADSVTTEFGASVMIRGKLLSQSSLLGHNASGATIQTSGVASIISPSKYIRETDSKCAMLTARTTVWDDHLDWFLSVYLADLFTKGTFNA